MGGYWFRTDGSIAQLDLDAGSNRIGKPRQAVTHEPAHPDQVSRGEPCVEAQIAQPVQQQVVGFDQLLPGERRPGAGVDAAAEAEMRAERRAVDIECLRIRIDVRIAIGGCP